MSEVELITNKTFEEIAIGDSASVTRTLTEDDLQLFATVSGDLNPTHFDLDFEIAEKSKGSVLGHGMWCGSLFSGLFGNQLPGPGTIYKSQNLNFHNPVLLGETVAVTVTVKQKTEKDKSILFDCAIVNDSGKTIVTGVAEVHAPSERVSREKTELASVTVARHGQYGELLKKAAAFEPVPTVVCHPCSDVALAGALEATDGELILPILVGPKARIEAVAQRIDASVADYEIIDTEHSHDSAKRSVELIREGRGELLMKGSLHTDEMMHETTDRDTGLRTERRLSHAFVMDVPTYRRSLIITDAGINIYPNLEDKADILRNAIELARALGVERPNVAILSAVETVTPNIASTIEAAALCKMADRGQIADAVLDGPLAFDNAISLDAANTKGISSPVSGRADIMLVPDLEAGNMLAKQLTFLANANPAGVVLGARVPIILTSRADSARARIASCAVAVILANARRQAVANRCPATVRSEKENAHE